MAAAIPGLRSLLKLAPINLTDGAVIASSVLVPLLVSEATKATGGDGRDGGDGGDGRDGRDGGDGGDGRDGGDGGDGEVEGDEVGLLLSAPTGEGEVFPVVARLYGEEEG